MGEAADPEQGPPVAESNKQHAGVSVLERNRSGGSRSELVRDHHQGSSKFRNFAEVVPRHKLAALDNLTMDRSASGKDARRKGNRDLSGIRREDVERKREEIGKERPRMRDENERRKEALALLRFKLEAHVKRTEKRSVTDGKRDADHGEDWGAKLLRKLADDTDNIIKVRGPSEREESIVVVSGSPGSRDAVVAAVFRQPADCDVAAACNPDQQSGAQRSRGEQEGPSAAAAEDSNVTVKDIYMVESVRPSNRPQGGGEEAHEAHDASSVEKAPPSNGDNPTQPPVNASSPSMTRDRSAQHLKLAEKVAKLMEDLDAPTDLSSLGPPRLKLRVMEDSETGPIVLMKCSSRDHARVVCETLSAKLGPEETIETKTSQGTRRQQHHFHFQGSNLLASFLKKAFSSKARSKSRPPKDGADIGSTAGNTGSFDSGAFDSSLFNSSNVFDSTVKDYVAATCGQDATKEADAQPERATQERGSAQPQRMAQLPKVQERSQDNGGVCASAGRKVRSANASPSSGGILVNESPARQPVSGYMARLLATPARTLGRARSTGRNRQGRTEDEIGVARGKGRLFGFGSPGRKKPQHLFEDRLGPDGNLAADMKAGKVRNQGRFLGFSSPARRKNNKSTGFHHAGADSPLHQDREIWSGILGSPVGDRGRGFGGAASGEQRWGFLGGLGSPVRDNRKCGNGWGPVYSLTDVPNDSGDEDTVDNREEPTSPEVTCIGRVKAKAAPRCALAKAAAGKAVNPNWNATQSVDRRKQEPNGAVPHSGPVLSHASKVSDGQPKQSRWKSLLGLYRGRAKGDPACGNMEKDICLSRCQKTSISRFGGPAPGPPPAQDTKVVDAHTLPQAQTECESCGNPKPCECATCTDGHSSFINRQARDSIQAWLAAALEGDDLETTEPWTDTFDQSSNGDEGPSQSVAPVVDGAQQQCLWQRREFSKPKPLDVGFAIHV